MPDDLRAALNGLRKLTHDELINFIVILEAHDEKLTTYAQRADRRKGKPRGFYEDTSGIEHGVAESATALEHEDRRVVYDMALTLAAALAPQTQVKRDPEDQPLARGTIQLKSFTRVRLNFETQQPEEIMYGPYVYIRLWATGGDAGRRKRRYKSIYIRGSKGLAAAYVDGLISGDAILDAYHASKIDNLAALFQTGTADATDDPTPDNG